MKVVFMGTPDFAVPSLQALMKAHQVVAVITQPDKPKGRGNKLQPSPVKEAALAAGIPVLQPARVKEEEFIQQLVQVEADVFVVAAYGQILPEAILRMPRYGCVNVHASLLPRYRGAGPIQWAIINGEEKSGVTIMYMDKGLDTGDMMLKKEVAIEPEDTYGLLHDKLATVGSEALIEGLTLLEKGSAPREKQEDSLSCYAPMITKETEHIRWHKTAREIHNLIRGLNPVPGAYAIYEGQALKFWRAEVLDEEYGGVPGQIVETTKKGLVVKAGEGALLITELQANKKMPAADYLRGHKMETGRVLE